MRSTNRLLLKVEIETKIYELQIFHDDNVNLLAIDLVLGMCRSTIFFYI